MPVYEYKCNECGHEFDKFVSSYRKRKNPTKGNCESCGEKQIEQKLTSSVNRGDSIRMGHKKPDRAFRERLDEISKAHPLGGNKNRYA